jgi:membrane protease YdiL (CAAX protease family)
MSRRKKLSVGMTPREMKLGLLYLVVYLLVLPSVLPLLLSAMELPSTGAVANLCFFVLNFLCCIVIFREFLGKSLIKAGKKPWDFLQAVLLGFAVYCVASYALSQLFSVLSPGFSNANDDSILSMLAESPVLLPMGLVLLVPPVEECLFRGVLFRGCYPKNRTWAYILSSGLFSCAHVAGYIGTVSPAVLVLCFLQYVPAGLVLAWAYEKADTIFAPIVIHGVINGMSVVLLR